DEKHYSAHLVAFSDSGDSHFLNDIGLFTTIGPVVFDTVETPYNENPPTPGSDIYFQITLRNEGPTATATDVSIEITTEMDSLITLLAGSVLGFGDIPAGDVLTTTSFYSVHFNDSTPVDSDITFNLAIASGDYYFWSDSFTVHVEPEVGIAGEEGILPDKFALHQNYPNPFNPITTIQYDLPEQSHVTIAIYDLLGREVTTLFSETQEAGYKSIQWNATNVSSGMYFYQIRAGNFVQTRKMVLLK
ncbi:MAG: T9SS type A sorting domain-containing protein, partial [Candidatus Marinimicrobia bacterium]|nr:T9SS type A sorting domain-containing protein [Candidatus Neomarinimicrobiota bacterium]